MPVGLKNATNSCFTAILLSPSLLITLLHEIIFYKSLLQEVTLYSTIVLKIVTYVVLLHK